MANIIKSVFHSLGLDVTKGPTYNGKAKFSIDGLHYGFSSPSANYAPWDGDIAFREIYEKIKKNTLVDIYRCYELWQLVEKANQLNPAASVLEVGVWRGGTGAVMAQKLKNVGASSKLYLADTFTGVVKASELDKLYTGGEHADTSYELVSNLMSAVGYKGSQLLQGIFPNDTADAIPATEKFSLCHIDVDVYTSAKDIVNWIWDRIIPGGMIVFDDYGFHWCVGITSLVEELRKRGDMVVIHNLNGHAIIVKVG